MDDWSGAIVEQSFSLQGNTLAGEDVITTAHAAYVAAFDRGAPLEERLLDALEAGSAAGGDNRNGETKTAKSAFLFVADPDNGRRSPRIEIKARDTRGDENPVDEVRERYDAGQFGCHLAGSTPPFSSLVVFGFLLHRRSPRHE